MPPENAAGAATVLNDALARAPLVAVLRGVRPAEAETIGAALVEAGVLSIEVPLNSPDPFESISALAKAFGAQAAIGAGTVLSADAARRVAGAGGVFAVAPNADPVVIKACLDMGLVPFPGFATPSEAFLAHAAGARHLKLFPADAFGPGYLKALGAVLPLDARVFAVGGVGPDDMAEWMRAGAAGFGLGSSLYRPGDDARTVSANARKAVRALLRTRSAGEQ